jgi:hypothetical protein
MRRFLILAALIVPLAAEPLADLLKRYVTEYRAVKQDAVQIADSIRARHDPTRFVLKGSRPSRILADASVTGDSVRSLDYERFGAVIADLDRMTRASAPNIVPVLKFAQFQGSSPDSAEFCTQTGAFKQFFLLLVRLAALVRADDPGFLPEHPKLVDSYSIPSYSAWYNTTTRLESLDIQRSLHRFDVRYGAESERINLLEYALISFVPPFKGGRHGPSALEPIFCRFTPACYDITDNGTFKIGQLLGINSYIFDDNGVTRLLSKAGINHFGLAVVAADLVSNRLYKFAWDSLSYGLMAHVGKFQVGVVKGRAPGFKVISTVDLQFIPGIF